MSPLRAAAGARGQLTYIAENPPRELPGLIPRADESAVGQARC